ncbi:MAG: homoserine O-acetyltransferase [Planctomycetes bacterium]|nr:homoserine O-acetyltransferase [Planctomycetota bacterium]
MPEAGHIRIDGEFPLALGGSLPGVGITFEQWGDVNAPGDRTVVIMPALSASAHVTSSDADPTPGWWEAMVGPGRWIDTDKWRVVAGAILGAPFGTTSPISENEQAGRQWGRDFPQITPADQARCHALLLDHLGLDRVHAIVGSSLGGMQVLQFAAVFPDRVGRIVAISATGKTTPGTVALRRVGRNAILNDPDFNGGRYESGKGPFRGLAVAREFGTICYRSRDEFNQRFDWNPDPEGPFTPQSLTYEVERYLAHQGERFANVFDANCYLLLSRCMDLMDLGAGFDLYADGVLRIRCPSMIIGVDRDMLIPPSEQQHLAHLLESHGREVRFEILPSLFGHDAFLKEHERFGPRVLDWLSN